MSELSERLWLPEGEYAVPSVGPRLELGTYPESSLYVENGNLGVDSALWGDRQLLGDTFRDPRAAKFADIFTRHELRLLDVRQLSLPERFETRDGAGRMDRLTTLLDSARAVAHLGGTFEQVVQTLLSDVPVTVGSHRLGDHLEGDYISQSARDEDISDYMKRNGLFDALVQGHMCDSQGNLCGSPVNLFELAQPNNPRRHDIVECPRPYSNADRDPFTWIEGLYLLPQDEIVEATRHMHRAEVRIGDNVEERIAYSDADVARRLYVLATRHQAEHWGNAEQNLVEELVTTGDKHRLLSAWPYSPIDVLRVGESEWFGGVETGSFADSIYRLAERVSREIKVANFAMQHGEIGYKGPNGHGQLKGVTFRRETKRPVTHPVVGVHEDEDGLRLSVRLPKHKPRQPINALVSGEYGLQPITELDGSLRRYSDRLLQWVGAYSVAVRIEKSDEIDPALLKKGVAAVNKAWHFDSDRPAILGLDPMSPEELTAQAAQSKRWVARRARRGLIDSAELTA